MLGAPLSACQVLGSLTMGPTHYVLWVVVCILLWFWGQKEHREGTIPSESIQFHGWRMTISAGHTSCVLNLVEFCCGCTRKGVGEAPDFFRFQETPFQKYVHCVLKQWRNSDRRAVIYREWHSTATGLLVGVGCYRYTLIYFCVDLTWFSFLISLCLRQTWCMVICNI